MERRKRLFRIAIESCCACGRAVPLIACIEDPVVIEKILTHLAAKGAAPGSHKAAAVPGATSGVLVLPL